MLPADQGPKKKKDGLGLYDKMGLDQRTDTFAPKAQPPDPMLGLSAEGALNQRTREEDVGAKVKDKLKNRRQLNEPR